MCHAALEYRRHRRTLLAQWSVTRQQRAQVQTIAAQARITVIGETLEVGAEIALIIHRQHESRHGRVQPIVAGVASFLDRTSQAAVSVSRVIAAIDLPLTVNVAEPRPAQVWRAYSTLHAALAIGTMAVGARQAAGGKDYVRRTNPRHDRLTADR